MVCITDHQDSLAWLQAFRSVHEHTYNTPSVALITNTGYRPTVVLMWIWSAILLRVHLFHPKWRRLEPFALRNQKLIQDQSAGSSMTEEITCRPTKTLWHRSTAVTVIRLSLLWSETQPQILRLKNISWGRINLEEKHLNGAKNKTALSRVLAKLQRRADSIWSFKF